MSAVFAKRSNRMRKPNILLITSDQQHYNTLGICNPEIRTPNLDRLAREGTLFTRAYCTNPTSTPSRASIITGLYPSQHGAWSLGTKLPEEIPTLGGYLEKAGYQTALVGKAHFQPKASSPSYPSLESEPLLYDSSFWEAYHGPFYGFRHVELLRNHTCEYLVGQHYALWLEKQYPGKWKKYFSPPTGTRSSDRLYQWDVPEKYHYNTWITERCCSLLDGFCRDKTPFFLWASFPDPHPPYLAPSPWCDRYAGAPLTLPRGCPGEFENLPPHFAMTRQENADWSSYGESGQFLHGLRSHSHITGEQARRNMEVYYGMISYLDSCAGMLLERLDELGMRENTLVVFTTDHGHLFGQHGLYYKGPFLYEDLIRVPLLVRYPPEVPTGRSCHALQSLVDLAPTLLDFCACPVPGSMSGVNQHRVWKGEEQAARHCVICENHQEPVSLHQRCYVDERYKLTAYADREWGELYDLTEDPGESNNLWNHPGFRNLKEKLLLQALWMEMGREPMWMPRISGA